MRTLLLVSTALAVMALAFWAYRENYRTQAELSDVRDLRNEIGLLREDPQAVMLVLPADLHIENPEAFAASAAHVEEELGHGGEDAGDGGGADADPQLARHLRHESSLLLDRAGLPAFLGADPGVDGVHMQSLTNGANRIVLRNLLIHDVPQYGINGNSADVIVDIYNNILYNSGRGIRINLLLAANASVRILNNTVYNSSSIGAISSAGGASVILLRNNIVHTGPANVIVISNLDPNWNWARAAACRA